MILVRDAVPVLLSIVASAIITSQLHPRLRVRVKQAFLEPPEQQREPSEAGSGKGKEKKKKNAQTLGLL